MTEPNFNKRNFERFEGDIPLKYSVVLGQEKSYLVWGRRPAVARNIGEGGMYIETYSIKKEILRMLCSGKCKISIEMDLPGQGRGVKILSEVMWMKDEDALERKTGLGVKFDEAVDREREGLALFISEFKKNKARRDMESFLNVVIPEELLPSDRSGIIRKLETEDMRELIPERGRAFFMHRSAIVDIGGQVKIFATVPITARVCEGHMPGFPFLPLGIAGWVLSQAGEILVSYLENKESGNSVPMKLPMVCRTGRVDSNYKGYFVPGDTLLIVGALKRRRLGISEVDTEAWLGPKKVMDVPKMMYIVSSDEKFWR
jgi:3-hydroxymyristoyl/3-hydroxydecanoyl-(acyl carrier protein) dehydratase